MLKWERADEIGDGEEGKRLCTFVYVHCRRCRFSLKRRGGPGLTTGGISCISSAMPAEERVCARSGSHKPAKAP